MRHRILTYAIAVAAALAVMFVSVQQAHQREARLATSGITPPPEASRP